ncbi:MAG: penicillin-binding protein 1A, partial [Gammaproteobacteria bacterium]|nr:penicillin-binding protein 1A [Gammaproteobacteria bacterium]
LFAGIAGAFLAALAVGAAYYHLEPDLPDIDNLREVRLQVPLKVYSESGQLIAEFGEKRRNPLAYEAIPRPMIQAILAAEDANFYEHPGVDYRGLLRAGVQLALTGEKRQGGSTITMQVARNFYLSSQKTYTRKLSEIFLALRIERELSKAEILELYLNKIYLGHRSYGVGAAALVYYGKPLAELNLAQTAMIAGLPKAPSSYNPLANPPRALERRNYVLGRMLALGYIDRAAHDAAVAEPVSASRYAPNIEVSAPYVAEMVRAEMIERFGEEAYTGGYSVYTSVNGKAQTAANSAVRAALDDYTERHGYFGAESSVSPLPAETETLDGILADRPLVGELKPAIVTAVGDKSATVYLGEGKKAELDWSQIEWARPYIDNDRRGAAPKKVADVLNVGDVIRVRPVTVKDVPTWRLAQVPRAAGALVAIDPNNGAIRALVGGYDFYQSKFNRVTQARRQPGSGFKAFIYSAALANGFTPASLINDAPVVFDDPSLEGAWRPENYSGKFFGPTRLRYALTKSRNLVSIRLLRRMGIETALQHIARFGFDPDQLPHNLSLALGSANVSALEMARAYAVLANGGFLVEPYLVTRIEQDGYGVVFEASPTLVCRDCDPDQATVETKPVNDAGIDAAPVVKTTRLAPRVLDERNRYLMYSMMQDVIQQGTATKARELGRRDLAGKTGTTNDQRDAWFNGFNQQLVANTWVGFDDNSKLGRGEVGGRAALPAWIDFMRVALEDVPDTEPEMPEDMVKVRIDPRTGQPATAATEGAFFEVFRTEFAPGATVAADEDDKQPVPTRPATVITSPPPTQDLF